MPQTSELFEVEGLWEEIVLRAREFAGRQVRVTVLADQAPPTPKEIARRWADECERITPEPAAEPRGARGELRRMFSDKFRAQGLHV